MKESPTRQNHPSQRFTKLLIITHWEQAGNGAANPSGTIDAEFEIEHHFHPPDSLSLNRETDFRSSKKTKKMSAPQKLFTTLAAVTALGLSSASATVLDFTGLTNYSNFSQNGMDMTATTVWNYPGGDMAHMDSGVASFKISTLGIFNLNSVFMVSGGGSGPARFTAFLGGSDLGFVDVSGGAGTYNFSSLFSGIDEFRVSTTNDHFTFDDVNFSVTRGTVPDGGSTLALLGSVIGGLAFVRRKLR